MITFRSVPTGEGMSYPLQYSWASLVSQLVKNSAAMQETWVGKIPWRREELPTLVFWPGEFHGLYSPWCHKESDMTEQLSLSMGLPSEIGLKMHNIKLITIQAYIGDTFLIKVSDAFFKSLRV